MLYVEQDQYDTDMNAHLERCVTALDGLAKMKFETDMTDDGERCDYLSAVEKAIDDLVFSRLRISARLAARIIVDPKGDAFSRNESVKELAAFNGVLDYFSMETVKL